MNQDANDQSGIHANPPPQVVTGFTAEPPAPAVGIRPRVRWVRLTLILLAVVVVVGLVVAGATSLLQHVLFGFPTTPMTVDQADRIASAGPPPGSTLAEVEAYLNAQGITKNTAAGAPSYGVSHRREDVTYPGWWMSCVGNQTVAECAGLKNDDVYSVLTAEYPDADRYFMGEDRVFIYFFFNDKDRLLKHWVDVYHVMP